MLLSVTTYRLLDTVPVGMLDTLPGGGKSFDATDRRCHGFLVASNGIRDSRIETSLEFLIMQNSTLRREERPRQRGRRKRLRPARLSERLRAWRKKRNLSQSEAGLKLQISRRTLQEWEQGRAMPRGLALVSLRQVIGG
jgi:DNA-binding transcriptional regulator YiaG